ncbi:DgyrCDS13779 [Dimorphilus gyrociliatus]|uniref:Amino acid transporter n=1 Tax=Dimorphilus gyrociliatus TaxID=2664684 RepID=A0A7I8WBN8_9ANNE|nr:DgyrCDS13779 [Dimorphilus gyrociliatus]
MEENGFNNIAVVSNNNEKPISRKKTILKKVAQVLKDNLLLILLLCGLVVGIGIGAGVRSKDPPLTTREQMYFRFPGELLMRMLKMMIVPLIVSTLIAGVSSVDAATCGRIGRRAVIYYMATTFIAVVIGIGLVLAIKPGKDASPVNEGSKPEPANTADSFLDLLRNMFPDNIVEACFKQTKTKQIPIEHEPVQSNLTTLAPDLNTTISPPEIKYTFEVRKENGLNALGLVVFSIAIGVVVSIMGDEGEPIRKLMECLAEASMKIVTLIIWYSPIGVMFLVAAEIIKMKDPVEELKALGLYIATVLTGLGVHGFIVLPLIYYLFVRKNPYLYMAGVAQALATALGTSSSSATLPVTYKCLEDKLGVSRKITRFVLPVGATINMDGTALYEAVAALFIAQLRGISLSAGKIVAASITATAASIGAAAVPQAGIVTMVIVLTALGLPSDDVAKIIVVDWMLDRFRTMINVWGDSVGAGIVAKLSEKEFEKLDESSEEIDKISEVRGTEGTMLHINPHDGETTKF